MAQPATYLRQYNFTNYATLNPLSPPPGTALDSEFSAIKTTLDQTLANLKLIQRDDGQVANLSVGYDQLKSEVLTAGINFTAPWLTGTSYIVGNCVSINSIIYRCIVAHTSGTFATDLAAGKWTVLVDLSSVGSFLAGTATGNGVTTAFNLGVQIQDVNRVIWVENGAVKTPTVDYTVSGTTLTRTAAPGVGVAIAWRVLGSVSLTVPSDGAVTTSKIADSAVTTNKIADLNVTTAKIADANVTLAKLAAGSVDNTKVVTNSLIFSNFQQVATQTLVGRNTAATGNMESVTATQVLDWLGSTQGQILYRDAATWQALAPGALGQVLRHAGAAANPSWVGSATLLASGTVSAVATLDLALPSGYKNFKIYVEDFKPVTNGQNIGIRFSFDNGSTYGAGAGAYSYLYHYSTLGSAGSASEGHGSSTYGVIANSIDNTSNGINTVDLDIYPGSATVCATAGYRQLANSGGTFAYATGVIAYGAAFGRATNMRLLFNSGNISAMTYALYGLN